MTSPAEARLMAACRSPPRSTGIVLRAEAPTHKVSIRIAATGRRRKARRAGINCNIGNIDRRRGSKASGCDADYTPQATGRFEADAVRLRGGPPPPIRSALRRRATSPRHRGVQMTARGRARPPGQALAGLLRWSDGQG